MKYFRMSYEEVVFKRSYLNILLLNRSIPSFDFDKDDDKGKGSGGNRGSQKNSKPKFRNESEFFMSLM